MIKTAITIGTESAKITDRDVFEYVREKMLAQNQKSVNTYIDDETGETIDGDDCQYFSYNMENEISLRCALGFVMNQNIFEKLGQEDTDATDEQTISVIALSNKNWEITSESWQMLALLQRIHDMTNLSHWRRVMDRMSYLFDSNGKFKYDNIDTEKHPISFDSDNEVSIDFEDLGIKLNITVPKMSAAREIANLLESNIDEEQFVKNLNKDVVNILDVETKEQQAIGSGIFLDLVDIVNKDIRKSNDQKVKA
jgi:hypothetical protein